MSSRAITLMRDTSNVASARFGSIMSRSTPSTRKRTIRRRSWTSTWMSEAPSLTASSSSALIRRMTGESSRLSSRSSTAAALSARARRDRCRRMRRCRRRRSRCRDIAPGVRLRRRCRVGAARRCRRRVAEPRPARRAGCRRGTGRPRCPPRRARARRVRAHRHKGSPMIAGRSGSATSVTGWPAGIGRRPCRGCRCVRSAPRRRAGRWLPRDRRSSGSPSRTAHRRGRRGGGLPSGSMRWTDRPAPTALCVTIVDGVPRRTLVPLVSSGPATARARGNHVRRANVGQSARSHILHRADDEDQQRRKDQHRAQSADQYLFADDALAPPRSAAVPDWFERGEPHGVRTI